MTTPTLAQGQKFLSILSNIGASREQIQNLLGNSDIVKILLTAPDLSKVSREKLQAVLAPPPQVIDWTPVHRYADKLRVWSERPELKFKLLDRHIASLVVPDHAGPYQPTSITFESGMGLAYDLMVVTEVLKYELNKLGVQFKDCTAWRVVERASGPELRRDPQLNAALLDISHFGDDWDRNTVDEVHDLFTGPLPGLEVYWLMALNAQVFAAIDYETIPGLIAPGLIIDSNQAPVFGRGVDDTSIIAVRNNYLWWKGYSIVVFREC